MSTLKIKTITRKYQILDTSWSCFQVWSQTPVSFGHYFPASRSCSKNLVLTFTSHLLQPPFLVISSLTSSSSPLLASSSPSSPPPLHHPSPPSLPEEPVRCEPPSISLVIGRSRPGRRRLRGIRLISLLWLSRAAGRRRWRFGHLHLLPPPLPLLLTPLSS